MDVAHSVSSLQTSTTLLRVDTQAALPSALTALGFDQPRSTLVLIGGASKLSDADLAKVSQVFTQVLVPLAEAKQLIIVDGGTDAGVMRLIGHGRNAIGGTFPLVGVAPIGLVDLPQYHRSDALSDEACPIEPHHTHCLLVPGNQWGDESSWLAAVATHLSGPCGSAAVLINGGEVTWKDAAANVFEGRPLLVVAGSGRTADSIAAAARDDDHRGGEPDSRAADLLASNLVEIVDLSSPEDLDAALRKLL